MRSSLLLVVCLAASVLPACGGTPTTSGTGRPGAGSGPAFAGATLSPPPDVSAVTLPDVSPAGGGTPFAMRAQPGGVLLAFFGFTSCPDVCPTTLADLRSARGELGGAADRVDVAMVTIDPARDTAENLNAYLGHFFESWHALRTDDPAALQGAQDAFGVTAERTATSGSYYAFDHTATVFVVDTAGRIVLQWPYGTEPDAMAADLGILLDMPAARRPARDTTTKERDR